MINAFIIDFVKYYKLPKSNYNRFTLRILTIHIFVIQFVWS